MTVKKKIGGQCDPVLAKAVKDLRTKSMGVDQEQFAKILGVSQAIVSQWENRHYSPTTMALKAMANLAPSADRQWWLQQAGEEIVLEDRIIQGFRNTYEIGRDRERTILVFGAAGAGPFRFVPQDAEAKIALPNEWLPDTGSLIGLRLKGDSMWPLMMSGSIVIVDRARRDPHELIGHLVAASDGEGVSVKYLRKAGRGFLLVPKNVNAENHIVPFTEGHRVIGEVVFHLTEARLLWE